MIQKAMKDALGASLVEGRHAFVAAPLGFESHPLGMVFAALYRLML